MKPRARIIIRSATIGALGASLLLEGLTAPAAEWSFDVSPYLWVAGVGVETSLPNQPPATPSGPDRFDTRISAGVMLSAQARCGPIGVFADFAWLRLDTEATQPGPFFSAGNLQSDFIHTTAALTYRLPESGKFHAEVMAGARLWNVSEDVVYTGRLLPGFSASGDKTWVDPVIGANFSYDLSERWSVGVKGLVGGFGVSADFAAEAFAGLTYRINGWCSTTAGYRYLHENYQQGSFALDLNAQGLLWGLGIHF